MKPKHPLPPQTYCKLSTLRWCRVDTVVEGKANEFKIIFTLLVIVYKAILDIRVGGKYVCCPMPCPWFLWNVSPWSKQHFSFCTLFTSNIDGITFSRVTQTQPLPIFFLQILCFSLHQGLILRCHYYVYVQRFKLGWALQNHCLIKSILKDASLPWGKGSTDAKWNCSKFLSLTSKRQNIISSL